MRMQLRQAIIAVFVLACVPMLGQQDSSKIKLDDIEINFISSYYQQDGNHSPVTGGRGTELLTNIAPSLNIIIPLDTLNSINLDGGVDFYSSASSDNINNPYLDKNHVSGPSSEDQRSYVTVGYKRKSKQVELGVNVGTSMEWDVFSYSGGLSLGVQSKDKNRGLDLNLKYFYDDWKLIYPVELRNGEVEYLKTDKRQSVNASLVLSTNLTKKINMSVAGDFVYQSGLLSTPFHRVYFENEDIAVVEQLPGTRIKYPIGVRLNFHATDFLIARTFYRYYQDSWGLTGHTAELTLPIKITQSVRIYPFYRYHMQGAVNYFAAFQQHKANAEFYTSDFDLSDFTSHKMGIGATYQPLFGLARFKVFKKTALIKSLSVRYGYYMRSDGLEANIVTLGIKMNIKRS